MPELRSRTVTHGRNMAGARALMRASGVPGADIGRKPIIAVANSFTEFVPGHTHLQPVGRIVSEAVTRWTVRSETPSMSSTSAFSLVLAAYEPARVLTR